MAVVYHEIYLPIDTESTFDYIVIKQGDAGTHRVRATLISNNRVYTIPTSGVSYYMKFRKPDNNYCLVEATVSDNTISAEVTEEMLRVSGTGRGEFMIVSGSDELKTATFHVKIVRQTFTSGDVQSHSDFAPFAALLQGAGAAASNANTAAAAANAAASLAEQKAQAIPDDYSDLVAEVAGKADQSNTYTKAQVDGLIEDVTVETDTTLAVSGAPADAAETGRQFGLIKADLGNLTPGLSQDAKAALLACIEHVWWTDGHGREYYNALQVALYPDTGLVSITAVFTQGSAVIYQTTPLNDLKAYLVVTGHYNNGTTKVITDYSLSGTLTVGTSTVTVNVNGKTTTFTVTVSAPYWDYEWYASSGALPEGMTADAYDFSTVPGALHVEKPVMDLGYIGDIRLYVECNLYAVVTSTGNEQAQSNPQIIIKNKVVSENQFKGCKVIASPPQTSTFYVGFGVNGTTAIIPEIASRDIHAYDISAINGVYSLTIDGTEIPITQNDNTTPYINFTGIASSDGLPTNTQIMNIKCIKYKRL